MWKKMKQMLKYNFKTLIGFETIYKLASALIFVPLFLEIFHLITKVSGYTYLTLENVFGFLAHPLTLLCLLLLLLLLTFYTLIDISTVIIILTYSYQKKHINIKNALTLAWQKAIKVFNWRNIGLPFLVIFLIPFLNIGISSSFIGTISLPEFILDFIVKNKVLALLYTMLLLFLAVMLFRWLYVLPYFILEDCDFKEARQKSKNLSAKHKIKDFLQIMAGQLLVLITYVLFLGLAILIIMGLYKIIAKYWLKSLAITIIWLLVALSLIILLLLATPISYTLITILFFQHKKAQNEPEISLKPLKGKTKNAAKYWLMMKVTVIILVIGGSTIFTYNVLKGKYNLKIEYVKTMEVTAHRGASVDYPENTMVAFEMAKKLDADWIELDVQQTKDQVLVVMHDPNLKRTTGVNKDTLDVTYEEIKKLDAGSFLDAKFKDTRIPTLEEVIKFAQKQNIKLNIELKPTGKETDFEKSVVELITKYDFMENCVVTSQVYEVLENVKKANPQVQTVYVMSLAYGDITALKAADNFSIEAASVNKTLVKKVHNAGKEIYVWTVNTKESINKMINYNVDNIITDNIPLAKETIYASKTSDVIQEYIKLVNDLFN